MALLPKGSSTRQPLPDAQWDQEGAWQLHQSQRGAPQPAKQLRF